MKRVALFTPILAALALVAVPMASHAHWDAGAVWFIAQFPDEAVPTIDGNHGDWDIVPSSYAIDNSVFHDAAGLVPDGWSNGDWDVTDFSMLHRVGWNENDNSLYFATQSFDDEHNMDRSSHWSEDDSWEVSITYDHDAFISVDEGGYAHVSDENIGINSRYNFSVPVHPTLGDFFWMRPGELTGTEWLWPGTDWLEFEYTFDGEEVGESTYFYEMRVTPIGSYPRGQENYQPEDIQVYDLEEGEIVHISMVQIDNDGDFNDYKTPGCCGYWSTFGTDSGNACCRSVNDWV
ncbi:MAG: hypothetical protein O3A47_13440, partial [Chloroflexi bacterium]|nr:hypothetical protein [Chloroflexota bacterium]